MESSELMRLREEHGFRDEEDWFDYRLEHDEKFLRKTARAREEIREGRFVLLDELRG